MSKELRAQRAAIDEALAQSQVEASKKFLSLLTSKAATSLLEQVSALRDSLVPASPEEQQLDAYLSVNMSITNYLRSRYDSSSDIPASNMIVQAPVAPESQS